MAFSLELGTLIGRILLVFMASLHGKDLPIIGVGINTFMIPLIIDSRKSERLYVNLGPLECSTLCAASYPADVNLTG